MRIAIVYNPRSGRGKALRLAQGVAQHLTRRGHTHRTHEMLDDPGAIAQSVEEADRVVVVGGDGTVHHLLPLLAKTRTPFYHCGTGTANLIGRELGMPSKPEHAVTRLERELAPTMLDLPTCNGRPFLIMVSLGIDASVIHRFEESRKRGGYRAYVMPVISEVLSPRPGHVSVRALNENDAGNAHGVPPLPDGENSGPRSGADFGAQTTGTGVLVIANMRSYGGGFNPCADARPDDGLLDMALIPCRTSVGAGVRYGMMGLRLPGAASARGRSRGFEVRAEGVGGSSTSGDDARTGAGGVLVQIDGEKAHNVPDLPGGVLPLHHTLRVEISTDQIAAHASSR